MKLTESELKKLIKKIIKEDETEWVDISPEDYTDMLKYVNGDGRFIKKFADYKGKKIRITGDLRIHDREVTNIDSIDYVDGDLNISYSGIEYFDKNKVNGIFWNHHSVMWDKQKEAERLKKLNELDQLRQEGEWDVNNDDDLSNKTEALFEHLKSNGSVNDNEDKYFIYDEHHNMFTWLGDDLFESEWYVYSDDEIGDVAKDSLKNLVDDTGLDTFREWVWESNIDKQQARSFLYDFFSDDVYNNPEAYDVPQTLSEQQKNIVNIYQQKINTLQNKLSDGSLSDEQKNNIKDEINDAKNIIEDINESPEGGYDDNEMERIIEDNTDNWEDRFPGFLENYGYPREYLLDVIDMDGMFNDVINQDGYGHILGSYDGEDNEYKINGKWYHVLRHN